tara:strand:+ start:131 stop:340 length:210 start_codon:yes stop_codon:yes gene_type:complete
MEIELELDNGFVCDFEPDFELTVNSSAIEKVLWKFHNGTHSRIVADVFGGAPASEGEPSSLLPTMRLCR